MIKYYCDGCGQEISRNYVSQRLTVCLKLKEERFTIEVLVRKNDIANNGELCLDCLMKILVQGKDALL